MSDIEFRIGGKDDTGKAIASATKGLSRLELSFGQIVKAAGGFAAVNAAVNLVAGSFSKLAGLVSGGVADFDRAQESARALAKAMELNGGSTDEAIAKNLELADALERKTNIEAESVAELMKSAAMLGVQNDKLGDVAQTAIGLSEAMGISLEDGLKKARLATEGNFDSFNKLIPSMKDMATNEEKLAAVMDLANKGMIQKQDAANGAAGAYDRMANRVGNVMEKVGEALSPFRELAFEGIAFAAEKILEALIPALDSMQSVFESSGSSIEMLKELIVEAINNSIKSFTFLEVVVLNIGTAFNMLLDSGSLQVTRLVEIIKHAFTVQIPAYAKFFGEVVLEGITAPLRIGIAASQNFASTFGKVFQRLSEFVLSGMKGGFTKLGSDIGKITGESLFEGFTLSMPELPEIAARAITDREKMLEKNISNTAENIADAFNEKLKGRLIGLDEKAAASTGKMALKMESGATGGGDAKGAASAIDKALGGGGGGGGGSLTASTGRLLTRGAGSDIPDLLRKLIDATKDVGLAASAQAMAAESAQRIAQENNAAINSALANAPKMAPALQ